MPIYTKVCTYDGKHFSGKLSDIGDKEPKKVRRGGKFFKRIDKREVNDE